MPVKHAPCIYVVIPCYNEQEVLPKSLPVLQKKLEAWIQNGQASETSRLLFVDDGSKDETWKILRRAHEASALCDALRLSRNVGHQNALRAGLEEAARHADAAISLDSDLQDDPEAMDEMLEAFTQGADVVYGVRKSRETDTFFKRGTAHLFYRIQRCLGAEVVYDHADYRLLSHRALEALLRYPETQLFLRGLVPQLGFRTATVYYERHARLAGESKYPLRAMLRLARTGLLDFSDKLLTWIAPLGLLLFFLDLLAGIGGLVILLSGHHLPLLYWPLWWVTLLCGLLLYALGLVAIYVGRLYKETKRRPLYHVWELLSDSGNEDKA